MATTNTSKSETGTFSERDISVMREQLPKTATEEDFQHLLAVAERSGLDPLARQLFLVGRWDKVARRERYAVQTSIDGFRAIADRTGVYGGQVGPFWCGKDGEWRDAWLGDGPPAAARVGVIRSDFSEVLWAVARFDAYVQTTKNGQPNRMWSQMGDVMIAKCAEALALRRAFPQQLSGLYTADEMGQASNGTPDSPPKPAAAGPTTPPPAMPEPTPPAPADNGGPELPETPPTKFASTDDGTVSPAPAVGALDAAVMRFEAAGDPEKGAKIAASYGDDWRLTMSQDHAEKLLDRLVFLAADTDGVDLTDLVAGSDGRFVLDGEAA